MYVCTIHINPGAGIFFELKHYKPSKRSISVKCFSFMELDELKSGPAVLEMYVIFSLYIKTSVVPIQQFAYMLIRLYFIIQITYMQI